MMAQIAPATAKEETPDTSNLNVTCHSLSSDGSNRLKALGLIELVSVRQGETLLKAEDKQCWAIFEHNMTYVLRAENSNFGRWQQGEWDVFGVWEDEKMNHSVNITGDGNVIGNENTVSVRKTTVTQGATMADFTALLAQMRAALDGAGLDDDTREVVAGDLDVVEGQIVKEKPSKSIVEAKLASMAAMAKNAAAIGAAATGLAPLIHKAIEMAQHLF